MKGVQIFGLKKSQNTRAAERFFKERRVPLQMVDLAERALAPGEIRRFVDKFGWEALLDKEGKTYQAAGLAYLHLSESDLLARVQQEPQLLRLPLVRGPNSISHGHDLESWKSMAAALAG